MNSYHNPANVSQEHVGPNHRLLSTEDLDKPLPEGAECWTGDKIWEPSDYVGKFLRDVDKQHTTYRIPLMLSDRLRSERNRLDEQICVVEAVEKGARYEIEIDGKWYSPGEQYECVKNLMENLEHKDRRARIKPAAPTPQTIPWTLEGTEAEVCADIAARQALGIAKYGVTVADNPLSLHEWLEHAYQETLDNAIYLKRAMAELRNGAPAGQEVEG